MRRAGELFGVIWYIVTVSVLSPGVRKWNSVEPQSLSSGRNFEYAMIYQREN